MTYFRYMLLDINNQLAAGCQQRVVLILAVAGQVKQGDALCATAAVRYGANQRYETIKYDHRALTFHGIGQIAWIVTLAATIATDSQSFPAARSAA
jgi:hypothetical protein